MTKHECKKCGFDFGSELLLILTLAFSAIAAVNTSVLLKNVRILNQIEWILFFLVLYMIGRLGWLIKEFCDDNKDKIMRLFK